MHKPRIFLSSVGLALAAALLKSGTPAPVRRGYQVGPGRATCDTVFRKVARSKYEPHQGKRECARRRGDLPRAALAA